MAEKKTEWVAKATSEINDQFTAWDEEYMDGRVTTPEHRLNVIEAIIEKYRPPEEKYPAYAISRGEAGVEHIEPVENPKEKLVGACYMAKGFVSTVCRDRNQDPNDTEIYRSICAALAEHEKEKL